MVVMLPLSKRPSNSKMIIFLRPDSSSKTTPSRNLAKRILSYQPTISLEEGLRKLFYNDLG